MIINHENNSLLLFFVRHPHSSLCRDSNSGRPDHNLNQTTQTAWLWDLLQYYFNMLMKIISVFHSIKLPPLEVNLISSLGCCQQMIWPKPLVAMLALDSQCLPVVLGGVLILRKGQVVQHKYVYPIFSMDLCFGIVSTLYNFYVSYL